MKRCFFYREKPREYKGIKISAWPGLHEEVFAKVQELLPPGSLIADMGAGQGALSLRLLDAGYQVRAFDVVPEAFKLDPGLLVRCDLSSPEDTQRVAREFRSQFDGVVAVEIVEHLTDPWRLVETAREMLRGGGYLFITSPNTESVFFRLYFLLKAQFPLFPFDERLMPGAGGPKTAHINPISPREINYILRHSGLRPVENEPAGLLPFVYYRGFKWSLLWVFSYLITPFFPAGMRWGLSYLAVAQKPT